MTNFMTCCQYQCNHARVYGEVSKQILFLLIKPKRQLLKIYEEWLTISAASEARYQVWMNSENCSLSRSIHVTDYFHFQPDTPDTPECHPHYTICMTTSINLESIINNTVGSIDRIAVALDT